MSKQAFSLTFKTIDADTAIRRDEGAPMRILVLGNFLGRTKQAAGAPKLAAGAIRRIDIDNFEHVMAALEPSLSLASNDPDEVSQPLVFRCLDDFHPDRLAWQDPILKKLFALKGQLKDPATFSIAAAALGPAAGRRPDDAGDLAGAGGDNAAASNASETDAETLERLFGAQPQTAAGRLSREESVVDELIRRLGAPQATAPTPDAGPYVTAADKAAGERLRRLLHDPSFQSLEAAWRSLYGLVSQVESGEDQIAMLSLDPGELEQALGEVGEDPDNSPLYRLLSETATSGPDAAGWSMIVGNYAFGPEEQDVLHLSRLGAICQRLGALCLAAAKPELLGCPDLLTHPDPRDWNQLSTEALSRWRSLRSSASAQAIALALPRVLLRLPYGEFADPCDAFTFEEMPSPPTNDAFLWGNPAFHCALVIAQAQRDGRAPPGYADVDDLPAYVYREGDDMRMQACAEVYLSEAAGNAILEMGCIPVFSYQRRNAVRIGPLQTAAITKTNGI